MEKDYIRPYQKSSETARQTQMRLFEKYFPEEGLGKRPFSVTINKKSVAEVYSALKNIENLPYFFEHLEKVQMKNSNQGEWHFRDSEQNTVVSMPMNIETDDMASSLVWKSETSAGFNYSIGIFLEPAAADRGTVVRMLVAYDTLAGKTIGRLEALLGKDAMISSKRNLYRLKAFIETGHVPTTEGQPSGREEDKPQSMKH